MLDLYQHKTTYEDIISQAITDWYILSMCFLQIIEILLINIDNRKIIGCLHVQLVVYHMLLLNQKYVCIYINRSLYLMFTILKFKFSARIPYGCIIGRLLPTIGSTIAYALSFYFYLFIYTIMKRFVVLFLFDVVVGRLSYK
jgi:hypothetical protein